MRAGRPAPRALLLGIFLRSFAASGLYTPPTKYLIVSNARNGTVGYAKALGQGNFTPVLPLVSAGLGHPQGIAVDQKRQLLLVADSALRKVVSYGLSLDGDGNLQVDEQTPVADDVESRWVAVDGLGNVYFSDETSNRLLRVPARKVLDGDATGAEAVFPPGSPGAGGGDVSAPGGVAADNFYVYWANKLDGASKGTVVRRLDEGPNASSAAAADAGQDGGVLASNLPKAYGVCLAIDNVFYTAPDRAVYGVKTSGGQPTAIAETLTSPRGCTWDGDGTIYVADRSAHAVFAFPGPMVSLAQTSVTKVVDYQDAFGVAVYSRAAWRGAAPLLAMLLPALAAAAQP